QLKKTNFPLEDLTRTELSADTLNSIDIMDENPIPLVYQSGYLTITGYDEEFGIYKLGFPNREVRQGFIRYLTPYYTPITNMQSDFSISNFVKDVRNGDAEGFVRRIESFFANGDYALMGDRELYFHNAIYLLFTLLGFYVQVERHTTRGRMDVLVQTHSCIYIIELKIDLDATTALKQIDEKGYADPFIHDQRQLFKIGINYSTEKRCIDDWKVSESR
ncbi:MAG: PD-(D/E)XK nuclease domain-containing protein, partial [Bacteroidales bacterium]|nr:PD-(D/E)XK nuclease domain-containing protein [Bacteroidales bacterium]